MNCQTIKFALIIFAFIAAACGAEADRSTGGLEDIDGTTYSHALTPDGEVDCASIHDALAQYGIDPALLEPEVVFQACIDSGDVTDDVCHQVAFSCFRDGCADDDAGHENEDSSQLSCEEIRASLGYPDATNIEGDRPDHRLLGHRGPAGRSGLPDSARRSRSQCALRGLLAAVRPGLV